MSRFFRLILVFVLVAAVLPVAPALAENSPQPTLDEVNCQTLIALSGGTGKYGILGQASYCYVVPPNWNHDLVIFAHGYVDPTMPGGVDAPYLPFEQLVLPGNSTTIPGLVTQLGFAFAITSYSKKGLAVTQGVTDVVALADFLKNDPSVVQHPNRIYLIGASEGGLVTTLAIEQNPGNIFKGGVATCGPVGDFQKQINYWGDFRVIFDFFFPGAILPTPVSIPTQVQAAWQQYPTTPVPLGPFNVWLPAPGPLQSGIGGLVANGMANPPYPTPNLIATTKAPVDSGNLAVSTLETTLGLLSYNVLATNDGVTTLGGQPYNNQNPFTRYHDPLMPALDAKMNADGGVFRTLSANPPLGDYQTSGRLSAPLVTMHNVGDPIVPYWHENLYFKKILQNGSFWKYINIPVFRYGHCNFKPAEALLAFWVMVIRAGFTKIPMMTAADTLASPEERAAFIEMATPFSQGGYSIYVPNVQK